MTKNICRACLTKEGLFQSVFLKESSSGVSINISEMLSACGTIQVNEGDGLPDQICSECSEQTVKMYLFKLRCEKNDLILKKRFKKGIEKWEKNKEKKCCKALKVKSKTKKFVSDICQENINPMDLLTNQEIVTGIKVEKLEIIDEDIEITFNSISPLLMENKESLFSCSKCDFVFVEKDRLDKHITELHIKKEPGEVFCDKNLKRKQQLVEIHFLLKNKPYGCDICFEGFSQISKLKEHMKTHSSNSKKTSEESTISNVVCDKEFHKLFKCDICEKKFTNSLYLLRHKRIHTGKKPYECDVCKKRFKQLAHLTIHKRTHTGEKPYMCKLCNKRFTQFVHLTTHERIHTGEKPYECDVCKKKFSHSNTLEIHKRIHSGEKPFKCDICEKEFRNPSGFRIHKRIHTDGKPFKCEICKVTFRNLSSLNRHRKIHMDDKPHECKVCQKRFKQLHCLAKHKKIHTGEKPYECDMCKNRFIRLDNLMRHTRIHTGKKPYECDLCKNRFIRLDNLMRHTRIHIGQKLC